MSNHGFLELVRLSKSIEHLDIENQPAGDELWTGITFRLEKHSFVIPVGELLEIINLPVLTPVPFSESWILGLANWRGKLLTVIDLKQRFLGNFTSLEHSKLLCFFHQEHYLALVLDQVDGIKYFDIKSYCADQGTLDSTLQAYSCGYFLNENQNFYIMDVGQLLNHCISSNIV